MKPLLSKLYGLLVPSRHTPVDVAAHQQSQSVWQDTGQVFYLENTLKLSYQANCGKIVMEKLNLKDLADILADIATLPTDAPLAQAQTANQTAAFNLTLCGVTWQTNGDTTRIKAIPEAAVLRSKTHCFSRSQAVFRHAMLLEHDDLLSPSLSHNRAGVYTYHRVSVEQFTRQIRAVNNRLAAPFQRAIHVSPENFDSAFSSHEQQQIDKVLASAGDTRSLTENPPLRR